MKLFPILKKTPADKIILISSVICFIYFVSLITLSHYEVQIEIVGVFVELLTIPFVILLLLLVFLSIKNSVKTKFSIKSSYFISFLLLVLTIIILTTATICE